MMIRVLMMDSVPSDPTRGGLLPRTHRERRYRSLKPLWCSKAFVRKQPVITDWDCKLAEYENP